MDRRKTFETFLINPNFTEEFFVDKSEAIETTLTMEYVTMLLGLWI
jgi:hypothetical protein